MASAEQPEAPDTDESGEAAPAAAAPFEDAPHADEPCDEAPRPSLQQRFSPLVTVLTTVHPQGLVIQVNRPFRQRVAAVGFERLVLEPTTLIGLRPGLLVTAACLAGAGLLVAALAAPATAALLSLPAALLPHAPAWLAATLFVGGLIVLLAAVVAPRHTQIFLDREAGLHPSFLRGGTDDAEAQAFVQLVRRAIIEFRCRPPGDDDERPAAAPRLAATLDALLAMRAEELLTEPELARFRELALRR